MGGDDDWDFLSTLLLGCFALPGAEDSKSRLEGGVGVGGPDSGMGCLGL